MAKTTTKIWQYSPREDGADKLLATFVVEDGKLTEHSVSDEDIKDRVKTGFHTRDGKLTLEGDPEKFVDLLGANYVTGTYTGVEVIND